MTPRRFPRRPLLAGLAATLALAAKTLVKRPAELVIKRTLAEIRLLLDIADAVRTVELHTAAIGFILPHEYLHQGRLACTIGPDKPDLIATAYLKSDIMKQLIDTKRFRQPIYFQQSQIQFTS